MNKQVALEDVYNTLLAKRVIRNKKEFASLLGISYTSLISALNGNERYLTDSLVIKAQNCLTDEDLKKEESPTVDKLLDEIAAQRKLTETALEHNGKLLTIIENLTKK